MTTEDRAKEAAQQSPKEKGQQRSWPKNPGAVFESWLKKQQKREDETGQVARWVRQKMAEGEWLRTESQKTSQPFGGKRLPSDERLMQTWRRHLRADHGFDIDTIMLFEEVFGEYRRARDDYRRTLG